MTGAGEKHLRYEVPESAAGERLDRFLAAELPDNSRSYLGRLIREGGVKVDGKRCKSGQGLKPGQVVSIVIPEPRACELEAEDIPLEIVYQDEHLAVIDKPAGLVVHPAVGHRSGTMVNALLHHLGDLTGIGDELRPGIVHRLDKDTSGLIMVAKSQLAHTRLVEMLAVRDISRRYAAVIWGNLEEPEGEIDLPIGRDRVHRQKMAVVEENGKEALTRYSRIDSLMGFDYIRVELGTGRTHQIRVHMSHLGHPILGDPVYGGRRGRLRGRSRQDVTLFRELLGMLDRQALHAFELSFLHPISGEPLSFRSELPADMMAVVTKLVEYKKQQGEE